MDTNAVSELLDYFSADSSFPSFTSAEECVAFHLND